MERARRRKPKIGYFGSGLAAYWPQFPRLHENVLTVMDKHAAKLEAMGCTVVRGGLVDRAERGNEVGDLFAREQVDLIIGEIMTYTITAGTTLSIIRGDDASVIKAHDEESYVYLWTKTYKLTATESDILSRNYVQLVDVGTGTQSATSSTCR